MEPARPLPAHPATARRPARRSPVAPPLGLALLLPLLGAGELCADPPAGYYSSATGLSGAALEQALHAIIDDHTRFPYSSSTTDTWDVLSIAHADPAIPGNVLTTYRHNSVDADDHTQSNGWNREHTWPSSYGFTNDGPCNYPFTDLHHLVPEDWNYNGARGNRPFDFCGVGCDVWPVEGIAGENNYGIGDGPTGTWQVWSGRRGDIARALLYMDIRYAGGTHGVTSCAEPELELTDNRALIVSNTSQNYSPAYMGELSILLQWHLDDPVDDFERDKNDVVFGFQGNRNPFIDHPEWVCLIWSCPGGDAIPPAPPTGLAAFPGDCSVALAWSPSPEPDLAGYDVYRAAPGGSPLRINSALVTSPQYLDTAAANGIAYQYSLRAIDLSANASAPGASVPATPNGAGPCGGVLEPWINELHYDNLGTDTGEGIEIAGPAGASLAGWIVFAYDGATGQPYLNVALSGTIPNQQNGFGTRWFFIPGAQDGSPDGFALVAAGGAVLEFISYEGIFAATVGPAAGLTSADIGIFESTTAASGTSLQRIGAGSGAPDFLWVGGAAASPAQPNAGQALICPSTGLDCDADGLDDACEIATGQEADVDADGVPDACSGGGTEFRRGDANVDGALDIADAIFSLQALFAGAPAACLDAIDANDDGATDIGDPVYLLSFTFSGGQPPAPPHPGCGVDPTTDALDCALSPTCP